MIVGVNPVTPTVGLLVFTSALRSIPWFEEPAHAPCWCIHENKAWHCTDYHHATYCTRKHRIRKKKNTILLHHDHSHQNPTKNCSKFFSTIGTRLVKKKRFFGRNHVFIFTTGKSITPPSKTGFSNPHADPYKMCPKHTGFLKPFWLLAPGTWGFVWWVASSYPIDSGWMRANSYKLISIYQPLGLHALYGDVLFIATCMHFACNINLEKKRNLRLLATTPWDSMADFSWSQCPSKKG